MCVAHCFLSVCYKSTLKKKLITKVKHGQIKQNYLHGWIPLEVIKRMCFFFMGLWCTNALINDRIAAVTDQRSLTNQQNKMTVMNRGSCEWKKY